jgi:hypothetical protein
LSSAFTPGNSLDTRSKRRRGVASAMAGVGLVSGSPVPSGCSGNSRA